MLRQYFPKGPICRYTPKPTSTRSLLSSTTDPAGSSHVANPLSRAVKPIPALAACRFEVPPGP
jgi:hypothetical protein